MAGSIRISPSELRDASEFLAHRLEAITNEANSLKAKLDDIGERWEGEARIMFFEVFNDEMWPIFNHKLPEFIEEIITHLNGTAQTIEDTDAQIAGSLRS